jgi:hypothetical protein
MIVRPRAMGVSHHFQQYFNNIVADCFYWRGKSEYTEKIIRMSQVSNKHKGV